VGPQLWLAHGGLGGLAVELAVVVGLAVLVVSVIVQGRREARKEEEAAAAASSEEPRDKG
jgi:hypothetical protein